MDANNLNTAPVAAEPEVLKTRDAAYDKIVKSVFQEFTRRKYSFIIIWRPFRRLWPFCYRMTLTSLITPADFLS
jgi:hypothetical protein